MLVVHENMEDFIDWEVFGYGGHPLHVPLLLTEEQNSRLLKTGYDIHCLYYEQRPKGYEQFYSVYIASDSLSLHNFMRQFDKIVVNYSNGPLEKKGNYLLGNITGGSDE